MTSKYQNKVFELSVRDCFLKKFNSDLESSKHCNKFHVTPLLITSQYWEKYDFKDEFLNELQNCFKMENVEKYANELNLPVNDIKKAMINCFEGSSATLYDNPKYFTEVLWHACYKFFASDYEKMMRDLSYFKKDGPRMHGTPNIFFPLHIVRSEIKKPLSEDLKFRLFDSDDDYCINPFHEFNNNIECTEFSHVAKYFYGEYSDYNLIYKFIGEVCNEFTIWDVDNILKYFKGIESTYGELTSFASLDKEKIIHELKKKASIYNCFQKIEFDFKFPLEILDFDTTDEFLRNYISRFVYCVYAKSFQYKRMAELRFYLGLIGELIIGNYIKKNYPTLKVIYFHSSLLFFSKTVLDLEENVKIIKNDPYFKKCKLYISVIFDCYTNIKFNEFICGHDHRIDTTKENKDLVFHKRKEVKFIQENKYFLKTIFTDNSITIKIKKPQLAKCIICFEKSDRFCNCGHVICNNCFKNIKTNSKCCLCKQNAEPIKYINNDVRIKERDYFWSLSPLMY